MSSDPAADEIEALAPASGFALVGTDCFAGPGDRLYTVACYERYEDALAALKERDQAEYMILYRDASGGVLRR